MNEQEVKNAMESTRKEICQAIKEDLFRRIDKEADYESGREKAVKEAIKEARGVIEMENESK